jgi:hypothetical protein
MRSKTTLIAGLTAALLGFTASGTAHAQTAPTFGVQATAQTFGYVGTYSDNPGPIAGGVSASAASNPPSSQFNNGYGLVYAETSAAADAAPGELHAQGRALAQRVTAGAFNSHPSTYSESRFYDVVTVQSDSLPVGSDVTLTFSAVPRLATPAPYGSGIYDGYVQTTLYVNSISTYAKWSLKDTATPPALQGPQLTLKTKVGARVKIEVRLAMQVQAYYFTQGPRYNGELAIDAYADFLRTDATPGITLVPDSGVVYPAAP